jgi:hypothetical protein
MMFLAFSYCDCFAAGIYCAEPCACQGCFNRPEYEDTVLETRQQIESRNPLAFAPKIVQHVTEFNNRVWNLFSLNLFVFLLSNLIMGFSQHRKMEIKQHHPP